MWTKDQKLIFSKIRKANKLIQEAKEVAAGIDSLQSPYDAGLPDNCWALEKYFDYYSHIDIEEYWSSSSAAC